MTAWDEEQLEYREKKLRDANECARLLGWIGLGLLALAMALLMIG